MSKTEADGGTVQTIRNFFKTIFLVDLLKGLWVTLKYTPQPAFTFQYPAEIERTATSARLLGEATAMMIGEPARYTYIHGALDAGYLQREGIETVQYGPGDLRLAHTSSEVVSVREVYDAARVLTCAALRYLA